ncbi:MAG: hypothetical protein V4857_19795 [Pseudomonadota bacterium]
MLITLCVDPTKGGHTPLVIWSGTLVGVITLWSACRMRGHQTLWIVPTCLIMSQLARDDAGRITALLHGLFSGVCVSLLFWALACSIRRIAGWTAWQISVHRRHRRQQKGRMPGQTISKPVYARLLDEQLIVTLVHGTFAPHAQWTTPGSLLYESIKREYGELAEIHTFVWSGENSHAARLGAGEALGAHLARLSASAMHKKHLIIAHSHGGNVALYALKCRPDLIPSLAGLVTMATPFLTVRRRQIHDAIQLSSWLAPLALLFSIFVVLIDVAFPVSWWPLSLVLCLLAFAIPYLAWEPLRRWILGPFATRLVLRQRRGAERLENVPCTPIPMLYAYVSYDEAGLGLKTFHLLGGVGHNALVLLRYFIRIGFLSFLVAFFMLSLPGVYAPELPSFSGLLTKKFTHVLFASFSLYGLALIVSAIWPWLVRGHRLGFGRDSIWSDFLLDIGASHTPPQGMRGTPCGIPVRRAGGLRHSYLYGSPEFLAKLSHWLAGATNCESRLTPKGTQYFDRLAPWLAGCAVLALFLSI